MKSVGLGLWIVYLLVALVLIEVGALILLYYLRTSRKKGRHGGAHLGSVKIVQSVGQQAVLREIARLRTGGELDETFIRRLSGEDKALFEVTLIDALTGLPRELQHPLRATLVKHGYDEHCARRLMRGEISDRVRASTLLDLLRPQSHTMSVDPEAPEHQPRRVRTARSGGE